MVDQTLHRSARQSTRSCSTCSYDYRTNAALYPEFQAFFRTWQPPTLIVWGKNDAIFPGRRGAGST